MFCVIKISNGTTTYYCGEANGNPIFNAHFPWAVIYNNLSLAYSVVDKYKDKNLAVLDVFSNSF